MDPRHFDDLAEGYDEARPLHPDCFAAAVDCLVTVLPPSKYPELLEAGIGTGRVAIPLAERGYRLTGVDTSGGMLSVLERRLDAAGPVGSPERPAVSATQADATDLPFADASFDAAIAVNLFYCVHGWEKAAAELLRVVRSGGAIVVMHTGSGCSIPAVDARYRELAEEYGFRVTAEGAESDVQVGEHLASLGCDVRWFRGDWTWTTTVALDEALRGLRDRRWGFTLETPPDVHARAIETLERELVRDHGDLGATAEVDDEVYFAVVAKP
jgi:ubiquinone/menaquinone biosynthesis C-methylase UbiE